MPTSNTMFICFNCDDESGSRGFKFRAEKCVCPKCGIDAAKKEYAKYMSRAVEIHFDPPHQVLRNRGQSKRLCDGATIFGDQWHVASGEPFVVTCPECRAHKDFPHKSQAAVVPEADFQV